MGARLDAALIVILGSIQLLVAGILISAVWLPNALLVGIVHIGLVLLFGGDGFDNIGLLLEPLTWYTHQLKVTLSAGTMGEFWAIPYRGM